VGLVDTSGRLLEITTELWATSLNLAMANGGKPAGTTAPPRRWTPEGTVAGLSPWDGRYAEALGQCVTASDAGRFAQALARGVEREGNEQLARLAGFGNAGGFLVCPLTAELREALQAMPQTEAGTDLQRLPEELRLELETLRRQLEGSSAAPASLAPPWKLVSYSARAGAAIGTTCSPTCAGILAGTALVRILQAVRLQKLDVLIAAGDPEAFRPQVSGAGTLGSGLAL